MKAQVLEVILAEGDGESKLFFMAGRKNGEVLVNLTKSEKDCKKVTAMSQFLKSDVINQSKQKLDMLSATLPLEGTKLSKKDSKLKEALTEAYGYWQLVENIRTTLNK